MALTRAMLKGMGLTEEQVSAIIDEHTTVTSALKDQIKQYQEDADKLPNVQKELNDLKSDVKKNNWQKKYEDEHDAFEKYKTDIADKEKAEKLRSAFKKLLTECKVGEKHLDSIVRVTDFSEMELTEDGNFKDIDKLKEKINSDWSGFIVTTGEKAPEVETPPNKSDEQERSGRAAELAAKYHNNLYGTIKED